MKLVLAEKPSVAQSIAKVLGAAKGFVAVPAYSCGSWNCDNSSGVLARLGCYESREYWRKSGSIYQVIR